MFAKHQPPIAASGTRDADGFKRVCVFVLATIRCQFPRACQAAKTYYASGALDSSAFFGFKLDGLDYVERNAETMRAECEYLARCESGEALDTKLIDVFARIPGIGLAKAGFLAQLLYGRVGCLDSHHLVRFGLSAHGFRSLNECKTRATRERKIRHYVAVAAQCGTAETLWNSWCEYVGKAQGYGSTETVSAMHLVAAREV